MSIIRFFPTQDAFISKGLRQNTGRDEILEIGHCEREGVETSARLLIEFSQKDILAYTRKLDSFKATMKLYSADRRNIPAKYTLLVYRLAEDWEEGLGRVTDGRVWTTGVSWTNRTSSSRWKEEGGTLGDLITSLDFNVDTLETLGDLSIDVTDLVKKGKIGGVLIMVKDEEGFFENRSRLSFFSSNTHTVYRPYLEIEHDDSVRDSELPVVEGEDYTITSNSLHREYKIGEKPVIRLGVRPRYPVRCFSTASLYFKESILPENSQWGIKDDYTAEMYVNFGEGTKISADNSGSFFMLDTSILTSGRYLDLLIRSEHNGTVKVEKVGSPFKVSNVCQT